MVRHQHHKSVDPDRPAKVNNTAGPQADTPLEDACRCKEVSVMPPRKLLGLMISDLAFWKKRKRG